MCIRDRGSRLEKLAVLYCKQLGINYKNLSDEEFRWLIRILKKSKKTGTHDLVREVCPRNPGGLSFGTDGFYQQLYDLIQVIQVERITLLQAVILLSLIHICPRPPLPMN